MEKDGRNRLNTKNIALGGIMTALSVLLLYLAMVMPSGRLVLGAVASLPVALMVIEGGYGLGFLTYAATGLLYFAVTGNVKGLISYGLFFGIYPVVKAFAEKLPNIVKEYALKFGFFNLSLLGIVLAFKGIGIDFMTLVKSMKLPFGLADATGGILYWVMPYALFLMCQIAFYVYDYGFDILLGMYLKKFKKIEFTK